MEKKKSKGLIGIIIGGVAVLLLCALIVYNSIKDGETSMKSQETKQMELFTSAVARNFEEYDLTNMSVEEAQNMFSSTVSEYQQKYGGSNSTSVDAFARSLLNNINSNDYGSVEELMNSLTSLLDVDVTGFVDGLLGNSSGDVKTLTMKSNTVCQSVEDSKYCIDNLSANVYVTDEKSTNWVVLLHGVLMSGSLMYNTLGEMYEAQGYNILAPDSRGHGNSGGSVAMGYLESLDVYDWIKDLNSNPSRYGVESKPSTIIVHGISLGGATTLQLATNPDIAAKKGGAYTASLSDLNVKGFIDDCGYTSMSGIITGMLSTGDTSALTSLLDSLGISEIELMGELQKILAQFNINGFEDIKLDSFSGINEFVENWDELSDILSQAAAGGNITGSNGVTGGNGITGGTSYNDYLSGFDWNSITGKYGNYFGNFDSNLNTPNIPNGSDNNNSSTTNDWYNGDWTTLFKGVPGFTNSTSNSKVTLINDSTASNSTNFLDGIVGTALMNLVGVGLTEDNYDYYSNVFAGGRQFPANTKVAIIHGTADTTVPYSNAITVASNVSPAKLVHHWQANLKPHAFIVVGTSKSEYSNLVSNFTKCVNEDSCESVSR